ncbi:hypothetical protein BXZ70DRAFT_205906 [Cristinia sonorae]|uniref:CS domain-containing protein n=1 Tax=Cristinia sonorae TaxID=1940300 RepID=A0A8K0UPT4_9AGAR|nr:hypothetical protein BXZ70DRAFT_205906 [Cristinia sonorae]
MSRIYDHYQSYSWHQSHDQATVLLLLPYDTLEEDVSVIIERNHIVAGVRGQAAILKGRLYGSVDVASSMWQLEPRTTRLSARERTTSSTSTASTQSSYAVVTEPDITSSFAASLEGGFVSEDDIDPSSPALSSPISSSLDENSGPSSRRSQRFTTSHPVSPNVAGPSTLSMTSSFSSLESLHTGTGRLLTLHLEKAESVIWPSLIIGPVPNTLSPSNTGSYPWVSGNHPTVESKYNMDPTSLVLIALDLVDIRQSKEEAFEYFIRAWHQAHVPSATIRLSTHFLPVNTVVPETNSASSSTTFLADSTCSTPTLGNAYIEQPLTPEPGTAAYYLHYLGGSANLAQLYLEAGLLYLEGTASSLLSSSYSGLSALRMSGLGLQPSHSDTSSSLGGTEAWRRDRDTARRYFERARKLDPLLDIPLLPPSPDSEPTSDPESSGRRRRSPSAGVDGGDDQRFKMPIIDISPPDDAPKEMRRRRKRDDVFSGNASTASLVDDKIKPDDEDNTWYLYLPGLVGASTALLVVGFLSFSSWRKGQGS